MALTLAMATLIGSIVAGIAASGANIVSSVNAKNAQDEANRTNIDLANKANEAQLQAVRESNEFTAAQAQIDRERQDNQAQRMMADYSAAGLNPLLAANYGGSYATPASAQGNVAQIQKAHVNPAAYDFSGMASAFSSMSNAMLISSMMAGKNGSSKQTPTMASSYAKFKKYAATHHSARTSTATAAQQAAFKKFVDSIV